MNYQSYQNLMLLTSSNTKRTLMHLCMFTNAAQSPKLKTVYRHKNSFEPLTRGSRMGLGSFVDINILYIIKITLLSFFPNLLNQIYTNAKTPKRKLGSFV